MPPPHAILFDVFGTVVNALGSLTRAAETLGKERKIAADWPGLISAWYGNNQSSLKPVVEGKRAWVEHDVLQRESFEKLIAERGVQGLGRADVDRAMAAWHRLDPWPDAVPALHTLKQKFILGAFSNGTVRELVDIARFAGLTWDVVVGADLFRTFKPDAKMYHGAAELLRLAPGDILLVAAHNNDLQAASKAGMRTCFLERSTEDPEPTATYDLRIDSLDTLASKLETAERP